MTFQKRITCGAAASAPTVQSAKSADSKTRRMEGPF